MKKFWKPFGWVCLGIFLQFKFNILYGIVFLENLNFHDRTYYVKMNMVPSKESLRILHVETIVHHSLGEDYFANVYIPAEYKVLNKKPYLGAEVKKGYYAYQMDMKRKYRDVLAKHDLILVPAVENAIPEKPITVHFENFKQRLHSDQTYMISTQDKKTVLEGPEVAEKTYEQKLGL